MTTEDMIQLEKAALERIQERRQALKMSEEALGKAAFSDAGHPQTKVSRLYHASARTGKAVRPALGEWLALCQALGLEPEAEIKAFLNEKK